ncbi:MAG: hypothetical protein JXA71_14045 [Chitinispirillaceae bacterium]|nr:hypothetical protein [Chitinispirillaceae bacterium]
MTFSHLTAQVEDSLPIPPLLPEALAGISRIEYDIPLHDYPFNTLGSQSFPSMYQSLSLTQDLTQAIHYTLAYYAYTGKDDRTKRSILTFGLALSELALFSLPGGYSWMHEEWHRAVLRQHGVRSHNGVYDFNLLSNAIPVSRVSDENLVAFKRDHPQDMIRLAAAGNEAHIELVRSLRKELFFNRTDASIDWLTLVSNTFQAASYVTMSSMPYADQVTREMERREGTDSAKRDILGIDFTAWVYDLFRPGEPYADREVHPSGTGIDRYIKHGELSDDESRYLLMQGILCWLNVFNPQLFLVNRFEQANADSSTTLFWNAAVVHHLTPFGFAVDGDVLLKIRDWNLYGTLHSFMNRYSYFPGVTFGVDDLPLLRKGIRLYGSAEFDVWFQPEGLRFESRRAEGGMAGSLGLKAAVTRNLLLSVETFGKSAGWKAGALSLSRDYGVRSGLSVWFPRPSKQEN